MRKSALFLAVLLAAAFTTTADAAKRKHVRAHGPAPVKMMPNNEAGLKLTTGFIANMLFPPAAIAAQPVAAPARRHVVRHHKRMKKA